MEMDTSLPDDSLEDLYPSLLPRAEEAAEVSDCFLCKEPKGRCLCIGASYMLPVRDRKVAGNAHYVDSFEFVHKPTEVQDFPELTAPMKVEDMPLFKDLHSTVETSPVGAVEATTQSKESKAKKINATAAKKYREKKRQEAEELRQRNSLLETEQVFLKGKIGDLKREISHLTSSGTLTRNNDYRLENALLKEEVKRYRTFAKNFRSMFSSFQGQSVITERFIVACQSARRITRELLSIAHLSMTSSLWQTSQQAIAAGQGPLSSCRVEQRVLDQEGYYIRTDIIGIPIPYTALLEIYHTLQNPEVFTEFYANVLGSSSSCFVGYDVKFEDVKTPEKFIEDGSPNQLDTDGCRVVKYSERLPAPEHQVSAEQLIIRTQSVEQMSKVSFDQGSIAPEGYTKKEDVITNFIGVLSVSQNILSHAQPFNPVSIEAESMLEGYFLTKGLNGSSNLMFIDRYPSRKYLENRLGLLLKKEETVDDRLITEYVASQVSHILTAIYQLVKVLGPG